MLLFSRNHDATKININRKDFNNRSPVIFAANFGDVEGLRILLAQGADFTQHGSTCSALTMAASYNYVECVEFLLDKVPGYDVNEIDPQGQTAIVMTCAANAKSVNQFATDAMQLLLDKYHVDVNSTNKFGQTPLIMACMHKNLEGVRLLLSKYIDVIDVTGKDNDGITAFAYATANGHVDIMKLVLETNKLDDSAVNDGFVQGFSNLKNLDSCNYLMKYHDVGIDVIDYKGRSTLMRAIESDNKMAIELLLSEQYINKIDIYQTSKSGTALSYAVFKSNTKAIQALLGIHNSNNNNNDYVNGAFAHASLVIMQHFHRLKAEQSWDGMKYLMSHCDIDVNTTCVSIDSDEKKEFDHESSTRGTTALISACSTGLVDEVKLLLSKYKNSINVNIQDDENKTAFIYAATGNHIEIMKLLLESNKLDNDSLTEGFIYGFANCNIEMVEFLRHLINNYNIDINGTTARVKIPALMFATLNETLNDKDSLGGMDMLLSQKEIRVMSISF